MEEERDDLVNYMQELVDLIIVDLIIVDLIIVDLIMEDRQGVGYDKIWRMKITERGKRGKATIRDRRTEDFT